MNSFAFSIVYINIIHTYTTTTNNFQSWANVNNIFTYFSCTTHQNYAYVVLIYKMSYLFLCHFCSYNFKSTFF